MCRNPHFFQKKKRKRNYKIQKSGKLMKMTKNRNIKKKHQKNGKKRKNMKKKKNGRWVWERGSYPLLAPAPPWRGLFDQKRSFSQFENSNLNLELNFQIDTCFLSDKFLMSLLSLIFSVPLGENKKKGKQERKNLKSSTVCHCE